MSDTVNLPDPAKMTFVNGILFCTLNPLHFSVDLPCSQGGGQQWSDLVLQTVHHIKTHDHLSTQISTTFLFTKIVPLIRKIKQSLVMKVEGSTSIDFSHTSHLSPHLPSLLDRDYSFMMLQTINHTHMHQLYLIQFRQIFWSEKAVCWLRSSWHQHMDWNMNMLIWATNEKLQIAWLAFLCVVFPAELTTSISFVWWPGLWSIAEHLGIFWML